MQDIAINSMRAGFPEMFEKKGGANNCAWAHVNCDCMVGVFLSPLNIK